MKLAFVFLQLLVALCLISSSAVAQWVQLAGPEGGGIPELFADGGALFAGTYGNGGVFRSDDGGTTWNQKINGMGYQSVVAMAKVGAYLLASGTVGLYRSTDKGETWTAASGLPTGNGVSSLAVIGSNAFAATMGKGVFRSTDEGATWAGANSGLPGGGANTYVGSIAAVGTTLLASATDNNVQAPMYRSTDMGASWSVANSGLPLDYSGYGALSLDGSSIYAGGAYLYKTTNNGGTWVQSGNGIPQNQGISEIAVNGSMVYAAASNFLYRSTNGGSSWSPAGGGLPFMTMTSVELVGNTVYVGTIANGVYASTDNGVTWTQKIQGLRARDMSGFILDGTTLYGNGNSIFSTTDGGSSWRNIRGNLKDSSSQPALVYASGATLFARDSPAQGLERSTDGGSTWTTVGQGLPPFGTVQTIIDVGGGLLTASSRAYRSTDNGTTWSQADASLGGFVSVAKVTRIGSDVYSYGMGVCRSTDEGASWAKADTGLPAFFQAGSFGAVGSTLFIGDEFSPSIFKSTNNGRSWQASVSLPSSGIPSQFLTLGNDLFACSYNNGIFISKNLGGSWTKISTGLPNTNYRYSLAIHNGSMYAGTSGNSVWKRPLSDVTAVRERNEEKPQGFSLEQNYPNPFNPATTIEFRIQNSEFIALKVYDLLGREVATLLEGQRTAGVYTESFDASALASGVYIYRLSADGKTRSRRMMLVK